MDPRLDSPSHASGRPRGIRSRRVERCAGCALTPALCLCALVVPVATRTRVVLLVHRVELPKPTNTARLVRRALSNASLLVRGAGANEPADERAASGPRLVLLPPPRPRLPDRTDAAPGRPG